MPKNMRHTALRSALSALARDGQLIFVNELTTESHKTKDLAGMMASLVGTGSALVLLPERNHAVEAGLRNLPSTYSLHTHYMTLPALLSYDHVIIPLLSLDVIKSLLGKKGAE